MIQCQLHVRFSFHSVRDAVVVVVGFFIIIIIIVVVDDDDDDILYVLSAVWRP